MDFDRSPAPEAPEAPGGSALVLVSVALFFIFCPFALLRASAMRISYTQPPEATDMNYTYRLSAGKELVTYSVGGVTRVT